MASHRSRYLSARIVPVLLAAGLGIAVHLGLARAADDPAGGKAAPVVESKAEIDGKTAAQWVKHLAHQDLEERELAVEKLLEFDEPPVLEIVTAWPAETQFSGKLVDETTAEGDLLDGIAEVMSGFDLDALPDLIKLLDHKEERMRASAAYFLGMLAIPGEAEWKTVGPLRKALGDKSHIVRETAAWALGQIGGTDAAEARPDLEKLAKQDPNTLARVSAAISLAYLNNQEAEEKGGKPVPLDPLVIKALSNEDDYVRACTVRYLSGLGEAAKDALPEVEKLLKDKHAMVRVDAAIAHGLLSGEPTSAPVFKELLGAKEAVVREQAAYYLGEVGDKSHVPALRKLAEEDPSRRVRDTARGSAEQLRDVTVEPAPET
jgi:HEAT repeat protein